MSTYEWISGFAQAGTAVFAGIGLVGLWRYVIETKNIAAATRLQGEILSYPTVTVTCKREPTRRSPYSRITVAMVNTSRMHVYATIKLEAVLYVHETNQARNFPAPSPYNGRVLSLAAGQEFIGEFDFSELWDSKLEPLDRVELIGRVKSMAYGGLGQFRENPPVFYKWQNAVQEWVAAVPQVEKLMAAVSPGRSTLPGSSD